MSFEGKDDRQIIAEQQASLDAKSGQYGSEQFDTKATDGSYETGVNESGLSEFSVRLSDRDRPLADRCHTVLASLKTVNSHQTSRNPTRKPQKNLKAITNADLRHEKGQPIINCRFDNYITVSDSLYGHMCAIYRNYAEQNWQTPTPPKPLRCTSSPSC